MLQWRVGSSTLKTLSDGYFEMPMEHFLTRITDDGIAQVQRAALRDPNERINVNAYLVRSDRPAPILIDAGLGVRMMGGLKIPAQFKLPMLPLSITSVAFVAANCGALEIVGIVAASAKYGLPALHFYWIGAIPAMVFLALFMLPIYRHSRALTVPDFLRIRYNDATHILSASCLAAMMALIAGIGLYAISSVLHLFFGFSFFRLTLLTSGFVLCYVVSGGLRATIYNEVLQFILTIVGLAPLMVKVLRDFHGIGELRKGLPYGMNHIWSPLPLMRPETATFDITGVVLGLGLVLSFGYWCTDFLLIQRALTARSMRESIQTPLIAAIFKLFFPALLVIPGVAAAIFFRKTDVTYYDQALPFLMQHYYGQALLALGISAILASLMSGLAGNISALSAVWTHDLYRSHINPNANDQHYLTMGRISTVIATILAVTTASIAFRYHSLMDYQTLLFSLFNAPLFATFLLGCLRHGRHQLPDSGVCLLGWSQQ